MCEVLYSLCGGDGRWGDAPNATSHIVISQKFGVVCYKSWNAKDETPKSLSTFKPPKHKKKIPIHSELHYTNRSQLQKNSVLLWIHDIRNAKYGLYQVV
jgi:hypothetical protein